MLSKSFSTQLRKAGQQFRTGVLGDAITETYKDADAAFKLLETACGYGFAPCRVANTGAIADLALNGPGTVDGQVMALGDRILVTGQAAGEQNGIYTVTTIGTGADGVDDNAAWTRAVDLNATAEVALGYKVRVLYGTTHACTDWQVTAAPAVLGTNTLTFSKITTALSATAARVLVKATSEALFDDLASAGVIDGDRLKAGGLTAANFKAALATDAIDPADQILKWVADGVSAAVLKKVLAVDSLDFSDVDIAAAVKAGTLPASKLAAGSATEGINGGDVKFTAAQAAGVLTVATQPVILELVYPDQASGNADWTGLIGKHEVIDFYVMHSAAGDADDTYQLQTAGGVAVTPAVKPGAAAGTIGRTAGIDPTVSVFANAAGIRIAGVKVGVTSSLAKCYVVLLPRA